MSYHLLILGCLLVFFSLLLIQIPALQPIDLAVVAWVSEQRSQTLNYIAQTLSFLGGMPALLFFATLWCIALAWYKKYAMIAFIVFGLSGSIACAWLLKYAFDLARPPAIYHLVHSYGASYPSAHSFYAASLAVLILFMTQQHPKRFYIGLIAVLWLLIMGISRVYLGVHYPSDVLAGWGMSLIWMSLLYGFGKFQFNLKQNFK